MEKTKSGEDFFHLAVAITHFATGPTPAEMSLGSLVDAVKKLKKKAKGKNGYICCIIIHRL